jgi:UDP-N-acetylmuramate--alanine ligase
MTGGGAPASSEVPDLMRWTTAHLIGIGGAGMSGIARLLLARGIGVSGSDLKDSRTVQRLCEAGATVSVGHAASNVRGPAAVVVSAAIPPGNPEVRAAHDAGIPVFSRAQVLAALMRGKRTVAVAGTHGKTTTTSMVTVMLSRLGLDPSFVIGGDLNEIGSGAGHGEGEFFVAEADESDGSFLLFHPDVAVITSIDEDHLDFYTGRGQIEQVFRSFAGQSGTVVAWWDDPGVRRALTDLPVPLLRYGLQDGADLTVSQHQLLASGTSASVSLDGATANLRLGIPGKHNLLNALAALGVASALSLPLDEAAGALASFMGVRRRFELRGQARGAAFVDDYAHNPAKVTAALEAARLRGAGRVVAVFQPHRYTRTQAMWRPLGESLGTADMVVITDVYSAGERPIPGVTGKLLVEALTEASPGKRVVYLPRRTDVAPFLAREVRDGDLVLTLGAGDITMVAEATLDLLRGGSP